MVWSTQSRYGAKREYQLDGDRVTVVCYDVLFYNFCPLNNMEEYMQHIDPDGGPYIYVGGSIYLPDTNTTSKIKSIRLIEHNVKAQQLTFELSLVSTT